MLSRRFLTLTLLCLTLFANSARATETENLGMQILPAPGKVKVDGQIDDWDLSSGVFACSDVENLRATFGVWFHAMYNEQGLYFLARWNDDSPLNNPGQTAADYGFAGDCLQVRYITAVGKENERGGHFTCWQGRDGKDIIFFERGKTFGEGPVKDAKAEGAEQAFSKSEDGKHYTQEIFIPWKMLTRDKQPLKAGDTMQLTIEPNFTLGAKGRFTIKDIFKPGITPDRVFTFMAWSHWGNARLEPKGNLTPRPVRLSDAREFPVHLEGKDSVVDWTGLIKSKELLGFKQIKFNMPEDGYASINIQAADGTVVRQLANATFFAKGEQTIRWDGLTTPSWNRPGTPVPAGEYTWTGLHRKEIGLRLVGYADNGGNAPWDGASGKNNWGGDHGIPSYAAADKTQVYLSWNGAEAGKAVLALDLDGNILWTNIRGGIAGAAALASDGEFLYVVGGLAGPDSEGANIYKLEAKTGSYVPWDDQDNVDLSTFRIIPAPPGPAGQNFPAAKATGIDARAGKLYLSFAAENTVAVLDAKTGKVQKKLELAAPRYLKAVSDTLVYVVSKGTEVVALNPECGDVKPFASGFKEATGITVDAENNTYIAERGTDQQVFVYDPAGKRLRAIGRAGGRAQLGAWTNDGMAHAAGIAVAADGKLWVAEADSTPKRISVWETKSGKFHQEFFGPTAYGALGGSISPLQPRIMVGQSCEWLLDEKTGRATCLGIITREETNNARFCTGSNGKLYLAIASNWAFNTGPIKIFERLAGDKTTWGAYKLRTVIFQRDGEGHDIGTTGHGANPMAKQTLVWSDANDDGEQQENEITAADADYRFSGWYMNITPDLTMYAGDKQFKPTGFTACGAPTFNLNQPVVMPAVGLGSADGKLVLQSGEYNTDHGLFQCFDIASKKRLWTYPDNFVGVHGSHNAVPAEVGMIRGSFTPCGVAKLPDPIGNVWIIPTNIGEWHVLTEKGFYLTRLFQPDPLKFQWPNEAVPGAVLDNVPCGMGGEDFGGSATLAANGKLYVQAGKTGFWNVEVTGLDTVTPFAGSEKLTISDNEVAEAAKMREQYLQAVVGTRKLIAKRKTPTFSGNLESDFPGVEFLKFQKQDDAAVRAAVTWDDKNLYLAYEVNDATPWANGADAPEFLYARGDTVDLQLATDPAADKNRTEPGAGDLRLSIGNYKGTPTAVLYRKVAVNKAPKEFSSGVIKQYKLESVTVVKDAKIEVQKRDKQYLIEAAIPWSALELEPRVGLTLSGDFGVTHGNAAANDTVLRTYWNNQKTGIVNDEVFELMMEPKLWGQLELQGE